MTDANTLVANATGTSFSKLERVAYLAEDFVKTSQQQLQNFRIAFDKDPHVALSFGMGATIKAAALQNVGQYLNAMIKRMTETYLDWSHDKIADIIVGEVEAEQLRKSRWPDHSVSVISEACGQERTSALAEFVVRMKESTNYVAEVKEAK